MKKLFFMQWAMLVGLLFLSALPALADDTECSKHTAEYVEIRPKSINKPDKFEVVEIELWRGAFQDGNATKQFAPSDSKPIRILRDMPDLLKVSITNRNNTREREFTPRELFIALESFLKYDLNERRSISDGSNWRSKECPRGCRQGRAALEVIKKTEPMKETRIIRQGYLVSSAGEPSDYAYQARIKIRFEGDLAVTRYACESPEQKDDKKEQPRKKSCSPNSKLKTDKGGTTRMPVNQPKNNPSQLKINPNGSFPKAEALRRIDSHLKRLRDRRAELAQRYDTSAIQTLTEAFQRASVYPKAMGYAKGWANNTLPLLWINGLRGFYDWHEANLIQSRNAIANKKTPTIKAADILYLDQGMSAWENQEQQLINSMEEYISLLAQQAKELGDAMVITDDPRYYDNNRYPGFKKSKEPEVQQHRDQASQLSKLAQTQSDQTRQLGKGTLFSAINATSRITPPPVIVKEEEDCEKEEESPLMDYHRSPEPSPGKDVRLAPHPFPKRK